MAGQYAVCKKETVSWAFTAGFYNNMSLLQFLTVFNNSRASNKNGLKKGKAIAEWAEEFAYLRFADKKICFPRYSCLATNQGGQKETIFQVYLSR
jgi:hypothetical protein